MTGPSRIDQTPVRMDTKVAEERQTPKTDFGSRMKDGIGNTASALASGAAVAAPLVPGGAIVSAAVSGAGSLGGSLSSGQRAGGGAGAHGAWGGAGGSSAPTTPVSPSSSSTNPTASAVGGDSYTQGLEMIQAQQAANMQFLTLQNSMSQESQQYQALSNVLKMRSDTAKNSIQNVH